MASLAEKDDVLARQDGVLHLWDDGFLETDDAREHRLIVFEHANQVVSQLFLNGTRPVARCPQLAKSGRKVSRDIGRAVLLRIRHISETPCWQTIRLAAGYCQSSERVGTQPARS
jgi:hypothetical protein